MSEPYDLTRIGPVLSLEPVAVECSMSDKYAGHTGHLVFIGSGINKYLVYHKDNPNAATTSWWKNARHIIPERTRQMTAQEIAMLPRGTAFVHWNGWKMYNPVIIDCTDGTMCIGNEDSLQFKGYILPNETKIRPFTTEESK